MCRVSEMDSDLLNKRLSTSLSTRVVVDEENADSLELADVKRSRGTPKFTVKYLISNVSAGYLIGKGGASIVELQTSTKARINISQSGEFFPGTLDRAVLIAGTLEQVLSCQSMVMHRILPTVQTVDALEGNSFVTAKILIPLTASGLIIGKAGTHIQAITEQSNAVLKLSPKEDAFVTKERILSITGVLDNVLTAMDLVVKKLNEDDEISKYVNPTTAYDRSATGAGSVHPSMPNGGDPFRGGGRSERRQDRVVQMQPPLSVPSSAFNFAETSFSATTTINLAVPDEYVGIILGSGGSFMAEITRCTGAKITVSRKGDFIQGTKNRSVTITGTPNAAQTAHQYIAEKLKSAISLSSPKHHA